MHIESPKEKSLIRIERLADDIRSKFNESLRLAGESVKSGNGAVVAAIECGKMLAKAKSIIRHGNFQKWIQDNCGDIHYETAKKWMNLAQRYRDTDLTDCKSVRQAYIACGILPAPTTKPEAIGTQEVDVFEEFVNQIDKLVDDWDLSGLLPEQKEVVRARLHEIEGRL